MSYKHALEVAGIPVLAFEAFGSYQGNWLAKVPGGYICGAYGSCSGCDAYESEFGYSFHEWCDDHYGHNEPSCNACKKAKAQYDERLIAFGRNYIEQLTDAASLRERFEEQAEWDMEAKAILEWLAEQEVA